MNDGVIVTRDRTRVVRHLWINQDGELLVEVNVAR